MQTTRNPKVLNKVLKYKLRPILDKISQLEDVKQNNEEYINSVTSRVESMKNVATGEIEVYKENAAKLDNTIKKANKNLSNLIKNTLYNPNATTVNQGGGEVSDSNVETKLLTDKTIDAACYGLIVDGVDYSMYGVTGKGIAIGENPAFDKEYDWMNPLNDEHPFPSFYVNDMLFVDSNTVLLGTNNGIVKYTMDDNKYVLMDSSFGLPSKIIYRIVKIKTSDGTFRGYLALTEKGIAFSPEGRRWTALGNGFIESCVSVSKTNLIDTPQSIVFIGTSSGLYYFDVDAFINEDDREVKEIPGLKLILPSNYINGIGYDVESDTLAVVTLSGLNIIKNVVGNYITTKTDVTKNEDFKFINVSSGLNTSSCYDCIYTVDHKLVVCTSNGLNITSDYSNFTTITKSSNTYNSGSDERLNSYICNKIIRKDTNTYTILHGIGLTEGITI